MNAEEIREEISNCRQRSQLAPTFMGRQYWLRKIAKLEKKLEIAERHQPKIEDLEKRVHGNIVANMIGRPDLAEDHLEEQL